MKAGGYTLVGLSKQMDITSSALNWLVLLKIYNYPPLMNSTKAECGDSRYMPKRLGIKRLWVVFKPTKTLRKSYLEISLYSYF